MCINAPFILPLALAPCACFLPENFLWPLSSNLPGSYRLSTLQQLEWTSAVFFFLEDEFRGNFPITSRRQINQDKRLLPLCLGMNGPLLSQELVVVA